MKAFYHPTHNPYKGVNRVYERQAIFGSHTSSLIFPNPIISICLMTPPSELL